MNIVEISGYVSHIPVEREFANGLRALTWRVKVPRSESGSDSIPCAISYDIAGKALIAKVENLDVGNPVQISGILRSRFWQAAGANASRLEVEVVSIKRISKQNLN
jgi:single-strand DNA-binding protein